MKTKVVSLQHEMHDQMQAIGEKARAGYALLAEASNEQKDMALAQSALALRERAGGIIAANAKDVEAGEEKGLDAAMLDRLRLDEKRVEAMAAGLETVATMPDPVNKIIDQWERPNGLTLQRVSIPLGVIGIIYESRPNVTADAAGLCIKSGNAVILRGGSESFHSSVAIVECIHHGLKAAGLPPDAVQMVPTPDRVAVGEMLKMVGLIDVIIPRGGESLTRRVAEESRIPALLHLTGNCHTYIHRDADFEMARDVLINAKMRRPGICGATESLLIDEKIAPAKLPLLADALAAAGCEMRGDREAQLLDRRIKPAADADWDTEYLAPILSIKVVKDVDEAIAHINRHGSHHTDAIVTGDMKAARAFLRKVDSAIVMHNASTQFADGGEFGFGAEIGISTGRLHARGPVGAEQLTTYKYVVHGTGQVRT
ncbi:MAG: glutamate-5-semialdehyde dehydrogenase [Pseudomonadota bacterium]|nr:glutamate-5-semialdehyde dehydrogenase [Pseudomonadota bacterium]MDE3038023.1 glutamate-5-semialdehyde dehydrogenase [Pseudomonadota bacterium]